MQTLEECVAYFKENGGFARLMDGLFDLYARYERCFGAVRLIRPSPDEERAVSHFFKRDYFNQALIRISLADFEHQIQKVFSPQLTLEALLEAYFHKRVIRRASTRTSAGAFAVYLESELIPRVNGADAGAWLREISAHVRRTYRKLAEAYNANPEKVAEQLNAVTQALNNLPGGDNGRPAAAHTPAVYVSEFALAQTGDASAFNANGAYGPLFLRALGWKYGVSFPQTPEECAALYFKAGLLTEGVLSQAVVRGLEAFCGGRPDEACEAYRKRNEAFVLTIENINRFTQVRAYKNKIFAVENLSVFSALNERLRGCPATLLCVNGGIGPAVTLLLDMLCMGEDAVLYYSGDMDYAGLCLADKFYLRYLKRFNPWRLDKAEYDKIISENDFYLGTRQKEAGLHSEDLAALLSHIRKKGKTAEQGAMADELANDILEMCGQG